MGLEIIFFTQIGVGILMFIFLQKITQIKNQLDGITKEVEDYIAFLAEDVAKEEMPETKKDKRMESRRTYESQNGLIQAVLQDFFP